jgi:hypothetical protein
MARWEDVAPDGAGVFGGRGFYKHVAPLALGNAASEQYQDLVLRCGRADYPEVNLWNKDGLPASPFRTDNFQMITAPK